MANQDLNARQLRFALGVLEGKPAGRAYEDAGFKARGDAADAAASRLLRNARVQAFLDKHRTKLSEDTGLTVAWVLQKLEANVERAMQAEPVMRREGNEWVETGEYTYQGNTANKALELIGKHLGMWNPAPSGGEGQFREWLDQIEAAREAYGDAE